MSTLHWTVTYPCRRRLPTDCRVGGMISPNQTKDFPRPTVHRSRATLCLAYPPSLENETEMCGFFCDAKAIGTVLLVRIKKLPHELTELQTYSQKPCPLRVAAMPTPLCSNLLIFFVRYGTAENPKHRRRNGRSSDEGQQYWWTSVLAYATAWCFAYPVPRTACRKCSQHFFCSSFSSAISMISISQPAGIMTTNRQQNVPSYMIYTTALD